MPAVSPLRRLFRSLLRLSGWFARRDRAWERAVSEDPERLEPFDDGLPMPPPYFVTLVAGVPSQRWFSEHGRRHAQMMAALAAEEGVDLFASASVLDIGCGCGRIARWLAGRVEAGGGRFTGVDIQAPLVEWCAEALPGRYHVNAIGAALPVADASVDVAYAYSVATHLTRRSLQRLLADVARVLRPGGVAIVTFQDERFQADAYAEVLAQEGYALSSPRAEGLNHMSAWATHESFREIAGVQFASVRTIPSDVSRGQQAVAVMRASS